MRSDSLVLSSTVIYTCYTDVFMKCLVLISTGDERMYIELQKCRLFYSVCSAYVPGIHMLNTYTEHERILTKMLQRKVCFGLCWNAATQLHPKVKLLLNSERGQTGHRCNLLKIGYCSLRCMRTQLAQCLGNIRMGIIALENLRIRSLFRLRVLAEGKTKTCSN